MKKNTHRGLTLREAARLQFAAELIQVRCRCKGNCTAGHCKCFRPKVESTLYCHGRDGGTQCTNTGHSAAPSGTFNLERNTRLAPPEPSHNLRSRRANTQGYAWEDSDPTSAEDTGNSSSDLPDLDTEEEEVLEEEEEEEEGNEKEGNAVLPAVQVRTSPDWNRPSSVQSSLLKFRTGIAPVHNFCALVRNLSGLVRTAYAGSMIIRPFPSPSGSVCQLTGAAAKSVISLLTHTL